MIEEVILRLECFGYPIGEQEREAVEQAMDFAREEICNTCNREEVPSGLRNFWIERACVNYLRGLGVRGVRMGDVTINFDNVFPHTARFRKMVW